MLRSYTAAATTLTTLAPGQSWFSPSKSGKPITHIKPKVTLVTHVIPKHDLDPMLTRPQLSDDPPSPLSPLSPLPSLPSDSSIQLYRKRKQSETPSEVSKRPRKDRDTTASSSSSPAPKQTRPRKRVRKRSESRDRESTPPELVYRSSRACSVSVAPSEPYELKCATDHDGTPGPNFISSESVVKRLMHSYKAYFVNPADLTDQSFEPHPTNYPYVDLEYPNDNACERFILLEPKDKDHYNPIMCLENSLNMIAKYYLTPEQQAMYGLFPGESIIGPPPPSPKPQLFEMPSSLPILEPRTPPRSPRPLDDSSPFSSPLSSLGDSPTQHPACTPESPSLYLPPPPSTPPSSSRNILRSLRRAIHLRDGPAVIDIMKEINVCLREIKRNGPASDLSSNPMRIVPRQWASIGLPRDLLGRIIEETYQRSVGPNVAHLREYSPFSSEVYGELMPSFTSDIIQATGLRPGSIFLDLGSGVGNVVLQTTLEAGCTSYGVEILPNPAMIGQQQLEQFRMRCRMWGVEPGPAELIQGDLAKHPKVTELMKKADVVLVNNFVFKEELNEAISWKFLDLKEGAIVVSLKEFAPPGARLTERNIYDISSIFEVTSRPYHSGSVSWSSQNGQYYLHHVDRKGYTACKERFERLQQSQLQSTGSRTRTRRSRNCPT